MIKDLGVLLTRHPIIMVIYGIEQLKTALSSKVEVCIIANIDPVKLQPVIELLSRAGKYVIVSINSRNGLSQDKGSIDYVAETGATGLLLTRLQTAQRAKKCGLVTMQKTFVADRSIQLRSLKMVEQNEPDCVQLMPMQILPLFPQTDRNMLPPIVTPGSVCNKEHVQTALLYGAIAVSSSGSTLWDMNLLR